MKNRKRRLVAHKQPLSASKILATAKEEYTYQVDKIKFIVTPVYKEEGVTIRDML
ncbi:MAG: hypothetical protein HFE95_03020 [Acutalibacter sp.]|nr:hypothetical protein [Acutalibacter sp.]